MSPRLASVAAICVSAALALGGTSSRNGDTPDEARRKAKRAASYVLLAESICRVSLQVGGMTDRHPFDRALAAYARGIGGLHAKFLAKLTPPEGAEALHKRVTKAVNDFARMADAHYNADYPTARRHRERCVRDFTLGLVELNRMKRRGIIPSMSHGGGKRR